MISKKFSDENSVPKAIIICGPTGSGKSTAALQLAEQFHGAIISADSRQIYRRLNIGTAKPTATEMLRVKHYMIDIADITEEFTAKKYAELAGAAIQKTVRDGFVPFIVGGSGLYLEALTMGIFDGPPKNPEIRNELESDISRYGSGKLYDELRTVDPDAALRISANDNIRIVRALEIFRLTGKPISRWRAEGTYFQLDYKYLWLGISLPKKELYQRIDTRVDQMISHGLIGEIQELVRDNFKVPILKKKVVGYYEIIQAWDSGIPIEAAIDLIKQHSRNYAKRQLTWFRNKAPVHWIDFNSPGNLDLMRELISGFIGEKT